MQFVCFSPNMILTFEGHESAAAPPPRRRRAAEDYAEVYMPELTEGMTGMIKQG